MLLALLLSCAETCEEKYGDLATEAGCADYVCNGDDHAWTATTICAPNYACYEDFGYADRCAMQAEHCPASADDECAP